MTAYKIFCDESCHLEHDKADVMVLGALLVPEAKLEQLNRKIKFLRHQYNYHNEIKWTKLHSQQFGFYKALIDAYFEGSDFNFKATVVLNKKKLNHEAFNRGGHNEFYYKMFYYTLRDFLKLENQYKIYLDYMDTLGAEKAKKLTEVLQAGINSKIDTYIIHSYEAQLIQLCDLFIGAIAYKNRTDIEMTSTIKKKIVAYLEEKIDGGLDYATPQWEEKFNIFRFLPRSC